MIYMPYGADVDFWLFRQGFTCAVHSLIHKYSRISEGLNYGS
jgi:hypothetical protein